MTLRVNHVLWIAVLASVSACSHDDGLGRVEVKGKVTYLGEPVDQGLITFRPANRGKGPAAGTGIAAGEYFIAANNGPIPGRCDVEIKFVETVANAPKKDQPEAAQNQGMRFKSFAQEIEISTERNKIDFELPLPSQMDNRKRPR